MRMQIGWIGILAGLLAAGGCDRKPGDRATEKVTSDDVRRDAEHAAKTTGDYAQQSQEQFQKRLETRLDELDADIAKLRKKGRTQKDEAKAGWDRKMADLQTKRDAARAKLTEVQHASGEAWKDVQKGAQSAWDDLEKSFDDASKKF